MPWPTLGLRDSKPASHPRMNCGLIAKADFARFAVRTFGVACFACAPFGHGVPDRKASSPNALGEGTRKTQVTVTSSMTVTWVVIITIAARSRQQAPRGGGRVKVSPGAGTWT